MKQKKWIVVVGGLLLLSSCNIGIFDNANTTEENDISFKNIKGASSSSTYTFPKNWQETVKTGLLTYPSYSSVGTIDISKVKEIHFHSTYKEVTNERSTYIVSNTFDKRDVSSIAHMNDDIMVVRPSNTSSPTWLDFCPYTGSVTFVADNYPYFVGTNITSFYFGSFKFANRSTYDMVMTGKPTATVTGTSVPYFLTDLKSVLSQAGVTYSKVTSIKFTTNKPDDSGYSSTGYSIGDGTLYKNGTDIVIYKSSSITAPSDMSSFFSGYTALKSVDFSGLNTSGTTNFNNIFNGCSSLTSVVAPSSIGSGVSMPLPGSFYDDTTKSLVTSITSENAGHSLSIHSSHTLTKIDAKEATCTEEGNSEYYKCSICGKMFNDSAASDEIQSIPVIAKTRHDMEVLSVEMSEDKEQATLSLKCKTENKDLGTVNSTSITKNTTDATCTQSGKNEYEIKYTYDEKEYTADYIETIEAKGHSYVFSPSLSNDKKSATINITCENDPSETFNSITTTDVSDPVEVEPTCEIAGSKTYTVKFTYDGESHEETVIEAIEPTGHSLKAEFKEFTKDDKSEAEVNIICENESNAVKGTVAATSITSATKQPTCTDKGVTTYKISCEYQSKTYECETTEDIEAKGHNFEYKVSLNEDKRSAMVTTKCSVCGYSENVANATVTSQEKTPATCETAGVMEYTISFSHNGSEHSKSIEEAIQATGHKEKVVATSNSDGTYSVKVVCKNEDDKELRTCTYVSKTEAITTPSTCEEKGSKTITITYKDGDEEKTTQVTEEIEATGHAYTYTVNVDNDGNASIDVYCSNEGNSKKETLSVSKVESKIAKDATHFEDGEVEYTVTYTNKDGQEVTAKVTKTLPRLTDELSYESTTSEDGKEQIKVTDGNDNVSYVDASVTSETTKEATCTEEGSVTYTYKGTFEGHEIITTKVVSTPKIDHELEYEVTMTGENLANVSVHCKKENGKVIEELANVEVTEETDSEGNVKYSIHLEGYSKDLDVTSKVAEYKQEHKQANNVSHAWIYVVVAIVILLLLYFIGYFSLYRQGKLDDKGLRYIYKILPRGDKNKEEAN